MSGSVVMVIRAIQEKSGEDLRSIITILHMGDETFGKNIALFSSIEILKRTR